MQRFLFAPLALAAVLASATAASAAPFGPRHPTPRERARWEATHRPAPRPLYYRPAPPPRPRPLYHQQQPRWDGRHR